MLRLSFWASGASRSFVLAALAVAAFLIAGAPAVQSQTLYGVTGDGASTSETLFIIDQTTGAPTFFMTLGNGSDGEVIAFNPNDGMMYHASGNSIAIFESINLSTQVITPISGSLGTGEIFGLVFDPMTGDFIGSDIASNLIRITTAGAVTVIGNIGTDVRGLALANCRLFATNPFANTDDPMNPFSNGFFELDPTTGAIINDLTLTSSLGTVTGANSVVAHPTTGQLFAILKVSGVSGRVLATVDPDTGATTTIGNMGDNFSSISFTGTPTAAYSNCSSGLDCQGNPPLVSDLNLTASTLNKVSATQGVTASMTRLSDALGSISPASQDSKRGNGSSGLLPAPTTSSDFASAMAALDSDGNGSADVLAVASRKTQHVWLLQLDASGEVTAVSRFGGTTGEGGFPVSAQGGLIAGDGFGTSLAWVANGGGMAELAIGAPGEDGITANSNRGGVWFVEINLANAFDGNVLTLPVSSVVGLIDGDLAIDAFTGNGPLNNVGFGSSLAAIDVDNDNLADWLAIGAANRVNALGHQAGGVWLLDRASLAAYRFSAPDEGVYASTQSRFGDSAAWLGDADGDGTFELAVGAPHHRGVLGGQVQAGVVHVFSCDLPVALSGRGPLPQPSLTHNITFGGSTGLNGIPAGALGQADFFGQSLASLGDSDGDSHVELAVGAPGDDDGGSNQGAVWVVSVDPCDSGVSMIQRKVSEPSTTFSDDLGAGLDSTDYFGWSVAPLGTMMGVDSSRGPVGGGPQGLAAGSLYDDDGGTNRGAFWVLCLAGGGGPGTK
jgi:hypothetical protein